LSTCSDAAIIAFSRVPRTQATRWTDGEVHNALDGQEGRERGRQAETPAAAEVLARWKAWDSLTCAETHAGAGKYLAADQDADKPHIADLFNLVSGLQDKPTEDAAGGRYYHLLQEWWSDKNRLATYPGRVLQAALFLTNQKAKAEFRVTEADKDTHEKLVKAVNQYGVKHKREKFLRKIGWLTEKDSLVLLIDPFAFTEEFGEGREVILN
jgi:hypothetical protein